MQPSLLVIGCGDLGGACASHFAARGWSVAGVRRQPFALPGVTAIAADITRPETLAVLHTLAPDYVLIVLTPGGFSDERYRAVYVDGLRNVLAALDRSQLRHIFWVSSTSVFDQDGGERLDETSPATPSGFSGSRLLEAETILAQSGLPHTSVRLGGIYGPGRDRLLRQLRDGKRTPATPLRISNRIHRDDAVGILQFLIEMAANGRTLAPLYLGVDTEPTPISDVERWFAHYLQLDYDAMIVQGGDLRGGNKHCSSARLQQLGYRFIYPSFREGLQTLLQAPAQTEE
jgi:nucleoside-diphosphate-sugar epimerase